MRMPDALLRRTTMKQLSRIALTALVAALLGFASAADDKDKDKDKEEKPAETQLVSASVDEVVKEFAKDRDAAWKKYTPQVAPKGKKGGTTVQVKGPVAFEQSNKTLQIKNEGGWTILFEGPVEGKGADATIHVKSVGVGVRDKLLCFTGKIVRSDKKDD
jgi:cation transport regulator ChaB